jgi:putative phage-type endonuclease
VSLKGIFIERSRRKVNKLEWHKERQKGIGGSDVGAIIGVNKWKSSFQVYLEKTEEIKELPEASEAAYFGTNLEELVAKEFVKRTGKKVRKVSRQLIHKQYPFMRANIDRRVVGENSLLECMTTSSFVAKDWEGEEVPASYILQCQHYMAVTGADKCYAAVLIGGQKLVVKEIERDEELIQMIIKAEEDFWFNHVEKKIPPKLDGSLGAERYLKSKFPTSNSSMEVDLKAEYKDKISRYLSLKGDIKTLEEEAKALENNLKKELGEAERGAVANFLVCWKAVLSNRVDSKLLKEKHPEVYKEVCKEALSRRFEIKEMS